MIDAGLFDPSNLFAWCIASHDPPGLGACDRAAMLCRLGVGAYAWGNRMSGAQHLAAFHAEVDAMAAAGIRLVGRYIDAAPPEADLRAIIGAIRQHGLTPDLWLSPGHPSRDKDDERRASDEAARIRPTVEVAAELGFRIGLYNHAGWFGDPRNQIAIIRRLAERGLDNVGIVHCQHWGHEIVDDFEQVLPLMQPHLLAFCLSGMTRDGRGKDLQFLPVGAGDEDLRLCRALEDSGWRGPLGIINHTAHPAEDRLADHLDGLAHLRARMQGRAAPEPRWRCWPLGSASPVASAESGR